MGSEERAAIVARIRHNLSLAQQNINAGRKRSNPIPYWLNAYHDDVTAIFAILRADKEAREQANADL